MHSGLKKDSFSVCGIWLCSFGGGNIQRLGNAEGWGEIDEITDPHSQHFTIKIETPPLAKMRHNILGKPFERGHHMFVGHSALCNFKDKIIRPIKLLRPFDAGD
jgi:hypothetical protein